jgi:hypothetical protein
LYSAVKHADPGCVQLEAMAATDEPGDVGNSDGPMAARDSRAVNRRVEVFLAGLIRPTG